ncbi:DUF2059 domain-containing protein [Psychrobacter pygoscelis]|uniref:DUF2059 domain-containing protein n=1 Tax=Psychrobacter pygoscelis TaxID=2488563 RepID=UPI001F622FEF|nr:DUF2059 domain-containing protein [Psychrobacter pygoscelis]
MPKQTLTAKYLLRVPSLKSAMWVAIMTAFGMHSANAELVIHSEAPDKVIMVTNAQLTQAQAPTDASIIKLMQVMRVDQQIEAIINGQQAAIEAINSQTQHRNQSSDDELKQRQREIRKQVQGLLGQYVKIMTGTIDDATDTESLTQAYIAAAKAYYTQAEVDAQIAFYDTPIGQSILDKQPQVVAAFLKQSMPDDMSETASQLSELLPQVKKIVKDML